MVAAACVDSVRRWWVFGLWVGGTGGGRVGMGRVTGSRLSDKLEGDCLSVCLGAVGLLEAIPWGILEEVGGREGGKINTGSDKKHIK